VLDLSGCLAAILIFFWRRIHDVYVFWLSLSISEAAEFRISSRFLIDAILLWESMKQTWIDDFLLKSEFSLGFTRTRKTDLSAKQERSSIRQGQLIFWKIRGEIGRAHMAARTYTFADDYQGSYTFAWGFERGQ
jgi:hypothetical protein